MRSFYLALGYKCNHKCIMCPLDKEDRKKAHFALNDIITYINSENMHSGDHVTVSGGEPTLSDNLFYVLNYMNSRGIHVTLLSNASGFASADFSKRIATVTSNNRFDVVTAIHSADATKHDVITGCIGSFESSISGIVNMLKYNINVTIKIIINGLTYTELPLLAEFIAKHFPPQVNVQFTSTDYSGNADLHNNDLAVTFQKQQHYFEQAVDILSNRCDMPHKLSVIEMPLCSCAPKYWKYFHRSMNIVDGYIAPNASEYNGVIHNMPNECCTAYNVCNDCDVRFFCPGAWKSAVNIMGEELLRPIKCDFVNLEERND